MFPDDDDDKDNADKGSTSMQVDPWALQEKIVWGEMKYENLLIKKKDQLNKVVTNLRHYCKNAEVSFDNRWDSEPLKKKQKLSKRILDQLVKKRKVIESEEGKQCYRQPQR